MDEGKGLRFLPGCAGVALSSFLIDIDIICAILLYARVCACDQGAALVVWQQAVGKRAGLRLQQFLAVPFFVVVEVFLVGVQERDEEHGAEDDREDERDADGGPDAGRRTSFARPPAPQCGTSAQAPTTMQSEHRGATCQLFCTRRM